MHVDLGLTGLGILLVISLAFGVISQLLGTAGSRWEWLITGTGWFVGGLVASEGIWGRMTVEEIQPIIDGLALDESLLGGLIGGIATLLVTRAVTGGTPFRRSTPST